MKHRMGGRAGRLAGRRKSAIDGGVFLEYCINTLIHCAPMKQRPKPRSERDAAASMKALVKALPALDRPEDVAAFLEDLCTPAELQALADRWRVGPLRLTCNRQSVRMGKSVSEGVDSGGSR